jgi:DNA-directed RNA polymerase specialized sigma24 family protein
VLWKLTGDKELFAEAMQYTLLGMWQHVEKLAGRKAGAYIYRIALTGNSQAWRNRIGRNGESTKYSNGAEQDPTERLCRIELAARVRRAMSQLPDKQGRRLSCDTSSIRIMRPSPGRFAARKPEHDRTYPKRLQP